jgi:hypothetical protein
MPQQRRPSSLSVPASNVLLGNSATRRGGVAPAANAQNRVLGLPCVELSGLPVESAPHISVTATQFSVSSLSISQVQQMHTALTPFPPLTLPPAQYSRVLRASLTAL